MPFLSSAKFPSVVAGVADFGNQKNLLGNPALPTLASAMDTAQTTVSLSAGTGALLPTDNFSLTIDAEILFVGSRSSDSLSNIIMGTEGSTAASHSSGAQCNHMITAKSLNQFASELGAIESFLIPEITPIALSATGSSGTAYYVSPTGDDGNDGITLPWRTLQKAANTVAPGCTVHVAPGTYSSVTTSIAGTSGNRIAFISDVKYGALIRGAPSGSSYAMWNNTANYVDIIGFDISSTTSTVRYGILNTASYTRAIGNWIHGITSTYAGGSGIYHSDITKSDNDSIGNLIHSNGSAVVWHGIYHANLRGNILNNIVWGNLGHGIHTADSANNIVIANNLAFVNSQGGILISASGGVTNNNTIVSNNILIGNSGYGLAETGTTGVNNVYVNNLVWNNSQGLVLQNGLTSTNTLNTDPLLVNYQANGSGDYHLQYDSPCRNSGTATGAPTYDFDGGTRPIVTSYDRGPYEYGGVPMWPYIGNSTLTTFSMVNTTFRRIFANTTLGNVAIVLYATTIVPNASVVVKKIDSSTNVVSIAPTGTDTIDGLNQAWNLNEQGAYVHLLNAGGGKWYVIAQGIA